MAINESYLEFVKDQLLGMGALEYKRMFGGVGIFKDGVMFAMIAFDKLRFKVDDTNIQDYKSLGMKAFFPFGPEKGALPYWEVPAEVLEDHDELIKWAQTSLAIARSLKK